MCHLRMASVLSSCVLCSPHDLTCRFQRSPGALRRIPHIKASLISATLIAIHPVISNLGQVCMHESVRTNTPSLTYPFSIYISDTHAHEHAHTDTHTHIEIPLVQMKAEVPREKERDWESRTVIGFPTTNEVHSSLRIIFQPTWNSGYINNMKWYKLTTSRAA